MGVRVDSRQQPATLGRYEIVRRLATGSTAETYLASAEGLRGCERLVVLKRILPKLTGDAAFVRMFLDEARLVAQLSHPNIVQFHDIEAKDGECFIVMEFLHGTDVGSILRTADARDERVPLGVALTIILDVCAGLHYAHEKADSAGTPLHLVHRDISPQNVFVTFTGAAKLLGFGIADGTTQTSNAQGTRNGKVTYISPEQVRSEPIDRRSDVFSLGIVLWELTTGRKLFGRRNEYEVFQAILDGDVPPPSQLFADYPRELEI
jgi:serine/threonine protein kinase